MEVDVDRAISGRGGGGSGGGSGSDTLILMQIVPILFQKGKKCRLHNGILTTCHKQGRCRFLQINTT